MIADRRRVSPELRPSRRLGAAFVRASLATLALCGIADPAAAESPLGPSPAAPATPAQIKSLPAGVHTFTATFSENLSVPTDRLLEGVISATEVVFPLPASWELEDDPTLVLRYDASAALLPDRSHLAVLVNGQPIASVGLHDEPGNAQQLAIRLPREVLQPYNHLELRAIQHVSTRCEDPFDPSLWTRIRATSHIDFRFRRAPVKADLASFPYPFFDETGYGPAPLSLVLGDAPSATTVEALGRLALTFGREASYRRVTMSPSVGRAEEAKTNAIAVGLPSENPAIPALLGDVHLEPGQGLLAVVPNPADPTLAVLVVTGADEAGLTKAAGALGSRDRGELIAGTRAIIDVAADAGPPPNRRMPHDAPEADHFTLAELGIDDTTVHGFHTPAVRVPLGLRGDTVVRPGGAEATIDFGYAARLDPRLSAMEVRVDGVTVRTIPLDDPNGVSRRTAVVDLPETALDPDSEVTVLFHLFPEDFDTCSYVSDATLWGTVYGSTMIRLERDHVAELPDLGRLRYGAWPFTLAPGAGEVVAVLPDAPTRDEVATGFAMAAALADESPADAPALRLVRAGDTTFDASPNANFILLGTTSPHALRDQLVTTEASLVGTSPTRQLLGDARELLLGIQDDATWGAIEELRSPVNPQRGVLVFHATDDAQLASLVTTATDPDDVTKLSGNLAVIDTDGGIRSLATVRPLQVGSYAMRAAMAHVFRKNWLGLGVSLIGGAFLFTLVKGAWARKREGK